MSKLIFKLETLNPKLRTTFFKHKNYTKYLAYSEYAIKNQNTEHGLFGMVNKFPNIENMESIDKISDYITNLADNNVPIYRGLISLKEYDANRLGYLEQEKWKDLIKTKLPSISEKLNIKYEDIQYVGAVHLEEGHPHFQFMIWSKSKNRPNYFVKYEIKNKLRKELTNEVFKEDLLPLYKEKDLAKKNILVENEIINRLKQVSNDEKFIKDIMNYEKNFYKSSIMRYKLKEKNLNKIIDLLLDLKKDLRNTKGSIKYQYLQKYPEIINKVNLIAQEIINTSEDCKLQIDKYIYAKHKILEIQLSDKLKLEEEKNKITEETQKEVLKMIGNKIIDFERKLLYSTEKYSNERYLNETRKNIIDIYDFLCSLSIREQSNYKKYSLKFKKQLSKQAMKEKAKEKSNESSFNWEDEI